LEADSELSALMSNSQELASALSRSNFDEALKVIDHLKDQSVEELIDGY